MQNKSAVSQMGLYENKTALFTMSSRDGSKYRDAVQIQVIPHGVIVRPKSLPFGNANNATQPNRPLLSRPETNNAQNLPFKCVKATHFCMMYRLNLPGT